METLTLNDGTVLNGHLIETETRLFLYIYGKTMTEVFNLLIDPEKMRVIKEDRNGEKRTVRGYKHLVSISEEIGGMVCTILTK